VETGIHTELLEKFWPNKEDLKKTEE